MISEDVIQKAINAFHLKNPAHASTPQLCSTGVRAAVEAVEGDIKAATLASVSRAIDELLDAPVAAGIQIADREGVTWLLRRIIDILDAEMEIVN